MNANQLIPFQLCMVLSNIFNKERKLSNKVLVRSMVYLVIQELNLIGSNINNTLLQIDTLIDFCGIWSG